MSVNKKKGGGGGGEQSIAKMLYVPNGFEMFETKWVQVSNGGG